MSRSTPFSDTLKLAVLDMAGTTLDVADTIPEALRQAFATVHLNLPDDAIPAMRGQSKRDAIRSLVHVLSAGSDIDDLSDRVYESFRESLRVQYSQSVKPIAGAAETMRWLSERDVAVVLTTGFDRDLAALLLQKVGWKNDLVHGFVAAEDVRHGRPEPDMIHRAMELSSIRNPSEVAVVGDTTADLDSGARAGAGIIVGVLSGAHSRSELELHRPTAILNSIADLPAWVATH